MKDFKKILDALDPTAYRLIEHAWGQNPSTIYNQIAEIWNAIGVGTIIFVVTRKTYGLKSLMTFLRSHGVNGIVVGKGRGDVDDTRMIEIRKTSDRMLSVLKPKRDVAFSFQGETYHANVGNAVFSKHGLDKGTEFLLKTFIDCAGDLTDKTIGDLGAGWGAISLILASEFPEAKIVAVEKEVGAFDACRENLHTFPRVKVLRADATDIDDANLRSERCQMDMIVSNFSFHISDAERKRFFQVAHALLKPQGKLFVVAEGRFVAWCEKALSGFFAILEKKTSGRYGVFICVPANVSPNKKHPCVTAGVSGCGRRGRGDRCFSKKKEDLYGGT